jgi:hypothetical protein
MTTDMMTELEGRLTETLVGGQTRSALEFVTDLGVPFSEVVDAIDRLQQTGVLKVAYQEGDETFFTVVQKPGLSDATAAAAS